MHKRSGWEIPAADSSAPRTDCAVLEGHVRTCQQEGTLQGGLHPQGISHADTPPEDIQPSRRVSLKKFGEGQDVYPSIFYNHKELENEVVQ